MPMRMVILFMLRLLTSSLMSSSTILCISSGDTCPSWSSSNAAIFFAALQPGRQSLQGLCTSANPSRLSLGSKSERKRCQSVLPVRQFSQERLLLDAVAIRHSAHGQVRMRTARSNLVMGSVPNRIRTHGVAWRCVVDEDTSFQGIRHMTMDTYGDGVAHFPPRLLMLTPAGCSCRCAAPSAV